MKELLDAGLLHGDCLTVTGNTVAENLQQVPKLSELGDQVGYVDNHDAFFTVSFIQKNVIYPLTNPISEPGNHMIILKVVNWKGQMNI